MQIPYYVVLYIGTCMHVPAGRMVTSHLVTRRLKPRLRELRTLLGEMCPGPGGVSSSQKSFSFRVPARGCHCVLGFLRGETTFKNF